MPERLGESIEPRRTKETGNYETRRTDFSRRVVAAVQSLAGSGEWTGHEPYKVELHDQRSGKSYEIEIRKGDDFITVQWQTSDNPGMVENIMLDKMDKGELKYVDPYSMKYADQSLDHIQTCLSLIEQAASMQKSHPSLSASKPKLPK